MSVASSVPVGSSVFFTLSLLAISILALILLRRFLTLRATPAYLSVPVFLALALPASVVLLVPIDLASSSRDDGSGPKAIWLPDRLVLVSWRIAYWLIFVLTWFVSPSMCQSNPVVGLLQWANHPFLFAGPSSLCWASTSIPDTVNPKAVSSILFAPTPAIS